MSLINSVLRQAWNVIPHSTIQYRKYINRAISDFGVSKSEFTEWKTVEAITQPGIISSFGGKGVELKDYKEMGLDWAKRYVTAWMPNVGLEPAVNRNGADEFLYDGQVFTVLQVENWGSYNGWIRAYGVQNKTQIPSSES